MWFPPNIEQNYRVYTCKICGSRMTLGTYKDTPEYRETVLNAWLSRHIH